jgi:hypothetical protein
MFDQLLYKLIRRLIFSRRVTGYEEHHGPCEDHYAARLGPLRLEANDCFVLDHADAGAYLRLPIGRGHVEIGYRFCVGDEQIRRSGCHYDRFDPTSTRLAFPTKPPSRQAQSPEPYACSSEADHASP